MAPVVKALQAHPNMNSVLCLTAQHREMLDQVLQIFAIKADIDLDLMQPSQALNGLSARIFQSIDELLASAKPEYRYGIRDQCRLFSPQDSGRPRRSWPAHIRLIASLSRGNESPDCRPRIDLSFCPDRAGKAKSSRRMRYIR